MNNAPKTAGINKTRQVLAAAFSTPDGGSRAAGAVMGAFPDRIANAAVLYVQPDGTPKFGQLKDWGAGRGALLGGLIGIIGGPLGILAGSGIGAAAARLRDAGFKDDQLHQLGNSLGLNSSAVVFEMAIDAIPEAHNLLNSLAARQIVTQAIDSSVADLFSGQPTAGTEPDPAAEPAMTTPLTGTVLLPR